MSNRPGLAKARQRSILGQKTRQFIRAQEASLRSWMDHADVVSEGRTNGDRYFGSTSIFLAWHKAPEGLSYGGDAAHALLYDPHLRVRALRLARREAEARATGNLSSMSADLRTDFDARGMFVTVDVEAALRVAAYLRSQR
ncbi:MAG: hypothetical protein JNK04_19665 [Myxococcales bacterium]|nr:hypothetical protein [Myxococcales bacterium]